MLVILIHLDLFSKSGFLLILMLFFEKKSFDRRWVEVCELSRNLTFCTH